MKITFLGGVQVVTGSRYLIEAEGVKILVDCGMFQGKHELSQHNWDPFAVPPSGIDAIVLTHAHIDHTGYIPRLVKDGFKGKIYCSKPTYALCEILLVDSGEIQEGDAKHARDEAHAMPLYTAQEAKHALTLFQPVDYGTVINLGGSLQATLINSHHILGSAFVVISDGKQKLTFSGDLGRPHQLTMKTPPYLKETDFLVLESTYGDRVHEQGDPIKALSDIVNDTVKRGGVVVIPAFAVERAQTILYCLYKLKQDKSIPDIPIFLDSPASISVTDLFCKFKDEHTVSVELCRDLEKLVTYTRTADESKKIDQMDTPAIIIAGSGMVDGGRVIYHIRRFISDAKNTIVFSGYQGPGTTRRYIVEGATEMNIKGSTYPIHAKITMVNTFSAHADSNEILDWLGHFSPAPKKIFITHGELESAQALQQKIKERFGLDAIVPKYLDSFDLD